MKITSAGSKTLLILVLLISGLMTSDLFGQEDDQPPLDLDEASDPDIRVLDESPAPRPADFWTLSLTRSDVEHVPNGLSLIFHPRISVDSKASGEIISNSSRPAIEMHALEIEGRSDFESISLVGSLELINNRLRAAYWEKSLSSNGTYLRGGLAPTCEGGIESRIKPTLRIGQSAYLENIAPFGGHSPLIELAFKSDDLGRLRIQAIRDVQNRNLSVPGFYSTALVQPAMAVEWQATFGAFRPLIQFGAYDQNHSNYKSVGFEYQWRRVALSYDYILDARYLYDHAKDVASIDRIARLRLNALFSFNDKTAIQFTFIDFGVVQGDIDIFGNVPPAGGIAPNYTDNKRSNEIAITHRPNRQFEIYGLFTNTRAEFLNPKTEELSDTVAQTERFFQLGLIGYFY